MTRATGLPLFACAAAISLALGCNDVGLKPMPSPKNATTPAGWPRTLTDDTGAQISLGAPPKRIVSLAPSNTEILFALGAGDRVVADTESCDYPAEARNRTHVGGLSAGDMERIQVALPDLVVAVGSINQKLIRALRSAHIPTLVVQPHTTNEVLASIRLIGRASGTDARAEQVAAETKARIDLVRAKTSKTTFRPRALIVYGAKPIYTSPPDSFIHDLIGVAGGTDIVQTPLPQNIISSAVVVERAPEVILCSQSLSGQLKSLPGWAAVPAVKNNRFFSTHGDAELTRPGPRIAAAAEQLSEYFHPELYPSSAGHGLH